MRRTWPLVGRADEVKAIEASIAARDRSGMVVRGAPGVGKSRIVREVIAHSSSGGHECRWAVGTTAAKNLPLGAFASWCASTGEDQLHLVRRVIDALAQAPDGRTVILGVDDAHLLDELSAFVLQQVVQRESAKVLLTVRSGEVVPAAVCEIWKDFAFDQLDVGPLSAQSTTELLSTVLGGPVDPQTVNRLWTLTGGNALYLQNIVEQEIADGRIVQHNGYWRWVGDPVLPSSLVQLIESRFGELPDPVGEVVDTLAVGEPIDLEMLRRMTDPEAIEEADARGLISLQDVEHGVEVRVAHPLYAEMRRNQSPTMRLRRLRGRLAAELATHRDADDIRGVVRRAALRMDSDLEPDPQLFVRAARGAVGLADLHLANRLAAAAIRAGAGADAYFLRAHALSWLFCGPQAESVLASVPVDGLTAADRAQLAYHRASNMLWALAEPARAKEIIDQASLTTSSQEHSWINAFLTTYWFAMDRPDAALQAASELSLHTLPEAVAPETAWVLTDIMGGAGRTSEAVACAELGYEAVSHSLETPHVRLNIADAHLSALMLAGRLGEALELAARQCELVADLPGAAYSVALAIAGRAALGAGDLRTAGAKLRQADSELSSAASKLGWGYRYTIARATAMAMSGATTDATAALDHLDVLRRPFRTLDFERALARAWIAAQEGAVSEAVALLVSTGQAAAGRGQFATEVLCLQIATQFGDHRGQSRLHDLESVVEGPRVGIASRFAASLHAGDAPALQEVSRDFEQMGDLVAAADAAAHAAAAHRHDGQRGAALSCCTRAQALAQRIGGITTPALRQATDRLPLTGREREITMLFSRGLSARAVAERLVLSVRTVEGHIYRAMAKTGTSSRDELIALLYPDGPQPR